MRFARVVVPGLVHHVTHRGNHRQPIFQSPSDRTTYQNLVAKHFERYAVQLLGYSWMTNHIHQADIPGKPDSLAKGVGRAHEEYSRCFQTQHCTNGHLYGDRFYSCVVEDERVPLVILYMELNAVRAGLVKRAWDWPWSSARAHVTGIDDTGLLDMVLWRRWIVEPLAWREMLEKAARDELCYEEIRAATRTGRPLGSDAFITDLEQRLGRILRPKRPVGRPRKTILVPP